MRTARALPVTENDGLAGMITDRDIAVRAAAQGKSPDTGIRDVMSPGILYGFEDEQLDEVSRNMEGPRAPPALDLATGRTQCRTVRRAFLRRYSVKRGIKLGSAKA